MATTDVKTLAATGTPVTPQQAQDLANQGVLVAGVIYEAGHGPIVTVRPELIPGMQDVGRNGPLVNDIGGNVNVTNANNAFGGITPNYYVPK